MRFRSATLLGAAVGVLALGYGAARVRAAGVAAPTLYYAGTLTANGAAVVGSHALSVQLFDAERDGNSACSALSTAVDLTAGAGRFRVPLHPDCAAALQSDPDLWVEVKVDTTVVGRSPLGAVPHAVTAQHAASATTADNAGSANLYRGADLTTSLVPTGTIVAFGGATAPPGWMLCDGAEHPIASFPALAAVLQQSYGVPAQVGNFKLPNLKGRAAIGVGAGAGLTDRALGAFGGEERHVLTVAEMPSHDHALAGSTGATFADIAANPTVTGLAGWANAFSGWTYGGGQDLMQATGGGAAHATMPPFLVVNYIIKI